MDAALMNGKTMNGAMNAAMNVVPMYFQDICHWIEPNEKDSCCQSF